MKRRSLLLLMIALIAGSLGGCGSSGESSSSGQMDYEKTKKMVVDILKTDDGKTAIQQIMSDEQMKQHLVMDQKVVKDTIQQTLTSDKGKEFWTKTFEDPKFSEAFAKSIQTEHEKVIKSLMKDPDYQAMMIEILQNPEMQKQMGTALKSQESRKEIQKVVLDTLSSPLFKARIQEGLLKAAQEMSQSGKQQQGQGGGQSQGSSGGGGQGGQSGGSSGGGQ
ncbi:spore germination lipoprotein GerD [Metabacillus sp. RGM 3146]|uniref:spore germination lipoprotein GerD n=1 Tax=Metabacillus sp. RGM 3146 TaxID=3401092 RepID=UPI003B9BF986